MGTRHLHWILTGPSFAVCVISGVNYWWNITNELMADTCCKSLCQHLFLRKEADRSHCTIFFPASILTSNVDPCSFTSVQEVVVIGSSVASIIHPLFKVIDEINLMRSSILMHLSFCAYALRSKKPVGKFNRWKKCVSFSPCCSVLVWKRDITVAVVFG